MRLHAALFAGLLALTSLGGCGDDDGAHTIDAGPDVADATPVATCETFATENEELLNASTEATVIQKTPTHPPVGDAGLP